MKKFEFRLASVLRLRQTQLDAEKVKLQKLHAERSRLENTLAAIDAQRSSSLAWVQAAPLIESTDVRALSAFLAGAGARKESLRQAIAGCDREIEEQRLHVLAAERNHKLLEKLKERKFSVWQADVDRELEIIAQEAWQAAARRNASL
jgi:flagellar export protein FliJ